MCVCVAEIAVYSVLHVSVKYDGSSVYTEFRFRFDAGNVVGLLGSVPRNAPRTVDSASGITLSKLAHKLQRIYDDFHSRSRASTIQNVIDD